MRKNVLRSAIAVIAAGTLLLGAGCGSASAAGTASSETGTTTVVAVTGGTPAPFVLKSASGEVDGQNVELTKAIFAKLPQYKLAWKTAEFSSIFSGLDAGRYQIAVNNFTKTKEREAKYLFSDALYSNRYVAVIRKDDTTTKVSSLADLAGKKVIVCSSGCNIALALQRYNKANPSKASKLVYSSTEGVDSIRQVENGVADVYLLDQPSYGYLKKKVGFDAKKILLGDDAQNALDPESYSYLVFPKGQEKLRNDVNKALKEVIKDGTSKKIDLKWFGSDQTPTDDAE